VRFFLSLFLSLQNLSNLKKVILDLFSHFRSKKKEKMLRLLFIFLFNFFIIFNQKISCLQQELSVVVEANTRECFHQVFGPNINVFVNFQVISGGDYDISFWLTSPNNRVLVSDLNKNLGQHQILTEEIGEYRLCFDNTFSHYSAKQVFFYIYTLERFIDPEFPLVQSEYMEQDKIYDIEIEVSTLNNTFLKIQDIIENAQRYQSIFRVYENIDRAIMERNYENVNFWSMLNIIVLLIVAYVQVIMIRSLFEDKSKIGRILRSGKIDSN
jgi:hypothetical protein